MTQLKKKFEKICEKYINVFIKKQGLSSWGWIDNKIGTTASFDETYFFSFSDIAYDINNNCEKGLIFNWQNDNSIAGSDNYINYPSYHNGLRYLKRA